MIDFLSAIHKLNPTVTVIRGNVAYDADGNEVQYDKVAVEAYVKANEYKAQRAAAYPPIPEQLDLIFHGGLDAWKAQIQAVKDRFPKE